MLSIKEWESLKHPNFMDLIDQWRETVATEDLDDGTIFPRGAREAR